MRVVSSGSRSRAQALVGSGTLVDPSDVSSGFAVAGLYTPLHDDQPGHG